MESLNRAIIQGDIEKFKTELPDVFDNLDEGTPPIITAMFQRDASFLRLILERTDWEVRIQGIPLFYYILTTAVEEGCIDMLTVILNDLQEWGELQPILDGMGTTEDEPSVYVYLARSIDGRLVQGGRIAEITKLLGRYDKN